MIAVKVTLPLDELRPHEFHPAARRLCSVRDILDFADELRSSSITSTADIWFVSGTRLVATSHDDDL